MLDTESILDGWRLRAHRVEQPERTSDLAIDDAIFPHHAISQLVRGSLVHSGEHLRLALDALHRRQLYPSAHFTALRGALVGGAQAVWILSPEERGERQERGLIAIAEMYDQLGKYYRSLANTSADAENTRLADQVTWLDGRRDQVASLRRSKAALNLTALIASAADTTFEARGHRESIQRLWREMSADAHVLGWSVFQRSEFVQPDRRTGIGEGKAPGSPTHVAEAFLGTYRILKEGWSLFDRRSEEPRVI